MQLGFNQIGELGNLISSKLRECGVKTRAKLFIDVTASELKKIDEDLYYRGGHTDEPFEPTEKELYVKFDNLDITIQAK